MAERKKRRVQDLVEESRYWDTRDLIKNLEEEMERLEQGLGHVIFDSEGKPVTMCVSPLPLTPKFETKQEGDEFTLKVRLPGVEKENIHLYVNRDSVEVRAVASEKVCRPFYVSVDTPWNVDSEDAQVKFENSVLIVTAKRVKKVRIPVK